VNIPEFLEARIVEDEKDAVNRVVLPSENRRSLTADDAERVHAECAAKRAILADRKRIDRSANPDDWSSGYSDANYSAVFALASVYSDHPDFMQEWSNPYRSQA
jgi:hypothetical protein